MAEETVPSYVQATISHVRCYTDISFH